MFDRMLYRPPTDLPYRPVVIGMYKPASWFPGDATDSYRVHTLTIAVADAICCGRSCHPVRADWRSRSAEYFATRPMGEPLPMPKDTTYNSQQGRPVTQQKGRFAGAGAGIDASMFFGVKKILGCMSTATASKTCTLCSSPHEASFLGPPPSVSRPLEVCSG